MKKSYLVPTIISRVKMRIKRKRVGRRKKECEGKGETELERKKNNVQRKPEMMRQKNLLTCYRCFHNGIIRSAVIFEKDGTY